MQDNQMSLTGIVDIVITIEGVLVDQETKQNGNTKQNWSHAHTIWKFLHLSVSVT